MVNTAFFKCGDNKIELLESYAPGGVIAKFIEGGHLAKNAVKIEFKKRNTILGIFVQSPDYEDLKSKNFWRIVY